MCLGGVPYYLSLLDFDKSLEENIFKLFFSANSRLENEFDDLYSVLFKNSEKYVDIVKLLAQNRQGLSHREIAEKTSRGGGLTKMLENLRRCDFIMAYKHYGRKHRDTIYRLTDFFSLFYLRFVENVGVQTNKNYWNQMLAKQQVKVWQGLTFELVGMMHVEQIKHSLGISGILTEQSTWRSDSEQEVENGKKRRAQIDLVIERSDRQIHLCEMKFSQELFVIDKNYEQNLREKMTVFRMETKTKKALLTTFITTYGIKNNTHSGIVATQVMMDDLFI
ncbi:MAG: ATP-binding protein, partial [Muribaculaceae bacterium]|nr:ATP-binding protein [Muribaculaceae bacterium]